MALPPNKTKLVCTIGPASESPAVIEQMIRAGMNVARLNFSHGAFEAHKAVIERIRDASRLTGKPTAILADLPGPKIRLGALVAQPIELAAGHTIALTVEDVVGTADRIHVSFPSLTSVIHPGDSIFLNDGIVQLEAVGVTGNDVQCKVLVGGDIRSRSGVNLPGIDLGIRAFTERDHECLRFAAEMGLDAVSQSFAESAADIIAVRKAAEELDYYPFIIAKIERSRALDKIDEILEAADGIMIARGDLGVEIPIEQIAVVQKRLIRKANQAAKPVITATQMLESMIGNRRPTRAESTDVANAVLDGTDCVMLSGESAIGMYPVEAVRMLAKIAAAAEPQINPPMFRPPAPSAARSVNRDAIHDILAQSVAHAAQMVSAAAVVAPTRSGATVRSIARYRLPVWIAGVSRHESTCRQLQFSYGVDPVKMFEHPEDWRIFARTWMKQRGVEGSLVILSEGPSTKNPDSNHRMEILELEDN
jgi:pyruvate kinase